MVKSFGRDCCNFKIEYFLKWIIFTTEEASIIDLLHIIWIECENYCGSFGLPKRCYFYRCSANHLLNTLPPM